MIFSEADIPLLAKGDKKAFLCLYESFFVSLCSFIRSYGLSDDESKDIVQELFCNLYKSKLPTNITAFKSYIYNAVRNRALNFIRDERRRRNHEGAFSILLDESVLFDKIVENELYNEVRRLLCEMPPQCKNIFTRVLNGDTSEKIAADLDLSVETVKTQRKKAKRLIRERYSPIYRSFLPFL
ncbi:MAG: RNA polymerase subunit sigma-24 [Bacteroidetes bacterium HGW-Bacteroidetes-5]|jgi:RNA polymerase sigma-70 factor (ECF subfamily)|nr:MAG: RNA polymerase subunit sigma-24 [Bacteroidetes bacterium HGW-Bacteroidetes-5]